MSIVTRQEEIRAEVEALDGLTYKELKSRYLKLTGDLPPKRIGRTLLKLAVAYEIQRKDHKALVTRIHKKLAKISEAKDVSVTLKKPQRQIKPGGRLVREWRGKSYEVYVADDGVFMNGKQYKSLSAVAHSITGAKWNGPRFFGLRSPRTESRGSA
ncbi:MAG: hypothetical protein DHS20C05_13740 [Hyphococcus sp.]|nr:MAG: hypothetical protein DHS20C05_13740 [Marinicaulis sp.]